MCIKNAFRLLLRKKFNWEKKRNDSIFLRNFKTKSSLRKRKAIAMQEHSILSPRRRTIRVRILQKLNHSKQSKIFGPKFIRKKSTTEAAEETMTFPADSPRKLTLKNFEPADRIPGAISTNSGILLETIHKVQEFILSMGAQQTLKTFKKIGNWAFQKLMMKQFAKNDAPKIWRSDLPCSFILGYRRFILYVHCSLWAVTGTWTAFLRFHDSKLIADTNRSQLLTICFHSESLTAVFSRSV